MLGRWGGRGWVTMIGRKGTPPPSRGEVHTPRTCTINCKLDMPNPRYNPRTPSRDSRDRNVPHEEDCRECTRCVCNRVFTTLEGCCIMRSSRNREGLAMRKVGRCSCSHWMSSGAGGGLDRAATSASGGRRGRRWWEAGVEDGRPALRGAGGGGRGAGSCGATEGGGDGEGMGLVTGVQKQNTPVRPSGQPRAGARPRSHRPQPHHQVAWNTAHGYGQGLCSDGAGKLLLRSGPRPQNTGALNLKLS